MNRNVEWGIYVGALAPVKSDTPIWCAWCNGQALFVTKIDQTSIGTIAGQIQITGVDVETSKETTWRIAEAATRESLPPEVNRAHILNFQQKKA